MKLPPDTKVVLFDMDGVIFNTEDLAHNVFAELAQNFGKIFEEADHKTILGTSQDNWSQYFVTKWDLNTSFNEFASLFWQTLKKETLIHSKLLPGFQECIHKVRKNGLRTALVTSTPITSVDPLLEKFELRELFDVVVTGDEIIHGKPDPEPYLLAMKRLNLKSNECVVIEDALGGVKSAKSAGCYVIAVPTTHALGLDYSEADCILRTLKEIDV
ncbi:MAG: HAD family phosphatase [Candidatus Uhrbacteria bacterium]|nr:HAD family phosphatase [Candidatus Uhrbacteria bacterium]